LHALVHALGEHEVPVAALRLGAIERDIGLAQQLGAVEPEFGRADHADADPDESGIAEHFEALADRGQDALAKRVEIRLGRHSGKQDREFVAAEPRHRVAVPEQLRDARGEGADQLVAGEVAERVVDPLEPVEVEQQHCQGLAPPRAAQGMIEPVPEEIAIGQARQ